MKSEIDHTTPSNGIDRTGTAMSGMSTAAAKASSSRASCLYDSLPLGGVEQSISDSSKAETRVFDLHLDQDDAPITGTLRVVDLNSDSKPSFTALSYCWAQAPGERCTHLPGQATDPTSTSKGTITCNSHHNIEVPWNCVDALWHLRKAHRRTRENHLTIWVDTICINQKDDAEKDYQITLMAKIYESARATYFWLGSGSRATDSAMEYLRKVGAQEYKYPHDFPWVLLFDNDLGLLLRLVGSSILPSLGQPRFKELDEIFQLPWIQRLWTFQEAILPSHAQICCGNKRIPWLTMVFALEYLNVHFRHPVGLIFPGSFRDWHRLSISWRERKIKQLAWRRSRPRKVLKMLSWNELATREALIVQHVALMRRIDLGYITGLMVQMLIVLSIAPMFAFDYIISIYGSPFHYYQILYIFPTLTAVFMLMLYRESKRRELATINIHMQLPSAKSLLEELLRRKSNSEKDKYFALLGIIGDQSTTGLTQQSNIEDIYKQLSLDILRHTNSLDMLLYTPGISNSPFSNSWVVDWRDCSNVWDVCRWRLTTEKGTIKWVESRELGDKSVHTDILEQFSGPFGSLRLPTIKKFCVPLGDALSVRGVIIGRLSDSQKPTPFKPIGDDSEYTVLLQSVTSFQKVALRMAAEFRSKFFQYLGALLVSGRAYPLDRRHGRHWAALFYHSVRNISERNVEELSEDTLRWLLEQVPRWWRPTLNHVDTPPSRSITLGEVDAATAWKHHVRLVKFLSEGKMVVFDFKNQSPWGRGQIYGGIAPEDIQDQDVVAILYRCPMPMILRPSQRGSFAVVGPSFIPGMMDGELSVLCPTDLWNWTDLELV